MSLGVEHVCAVCEHPLPETLGAPPDRKVCLWGWVTQQDAKELGISPGGV